MPKTKRAKKYCGKGKRTSAVASKLDCVSENSNGEPRPTLQLGTSCSDSDQTVEAMKLAREFRQLCSSKANPVYAAAMHKYMRKQFSFFGLKAPERRKLQKEFTATHRDKLTRRSFLLEFVCCLWKQDERECQLYGVDLMSQFDSTALGETQAEFDEAVTCIQSLITTKSWWDTVDLLASHSEFN